MAFWSKKPGEAGKDSPPPAAAPVPLTNGAAPAGPPPAAASRAPAPAAAPAQPSTPPPAAPPAGEAATPTLTPEELRNRAAVSKMMAASLGEILAVMMRVPQHKQTTLGQIERNVLPAVLTGQFSIADAQSRTTGAAGPIAFVLWASVSDEVNQRLSSAGETPPSLEPQEWKSGAHLWLIEAIGETRVVNALLKRAQETTWTGRPVKMRVKGQDGKMQVVQLGQTAAQPASAPTA